MPHGPCSSILNPVCAPANSEDRSRIEEPQWCAPSSCLPEISFERYVMAIPRTRPSAYPAVFSYGFRPFFLLGALQAGAAVLFWLPLFYGRLETFSVFSP